jgi:hypothetical protein
VDGWKRLFGYQDSEFPFSAWEYAATTFRLPDNQSFIAANPVYQAFFNHASDQWEKPW